MDCRAEGIPGSRLAPFLLEMRNQRPGEVGALEGTDPRTFSNPHSPCPTAGWSTEHDHHFSQCLVAQRGPQSGPLPQSWCRAKGQNGCRRTSRHTGRAQRCTSITPAQGRRRQQDDCRFEASLNSSETLSPNKKRETLPASHKA